MGEHDNDTYETMPSIVGQAVGRISLLDRQVAERGQIEGVPTTQLGAVSLGDVPRDFMSMSPNYPGNEVPGID